MFINHITIIRKTVKKDSKTPNIIFMCWKCYKWFPSFNNRKRCKCGKLNIV